MILLNMLLSFSIASAFEVNMYDSVEKGMVVVELIDDCKYSHRLLISLENAKTYKVTDWHELLVVSGEWDKCK